MKLWLVQMQPRLLDKEGNLEKIKGYLTQAIQNKVDLVAFPELALTGYACHEKFYDLAEPIVGRSTEQIISMLKGTTTYVIMGLPELKGVYLYNSAVVIGAEGVVSVYRKLFLATSWSPSALFDEGMFFRPGTEIVTPELQCGKIGIEICRDINYPEITRTQAYLGALLFICISAAPMTSVGDVSLRERFQILGRARAVENCAWYGYVNQAGKDKDAQTYAGGSFIASYSGQVVKSASAGDNAREEVIEHDVDMEEVIRARIVYPHLREARPGILGSEIEAMLSL